MVKSREDVITRFHEQVNMSVDELQKWLDDPKSKKAGTGVGIESGHKIIEILKKNPDKDPEKYDEEDIEHMRKVVSYNSRHLAQEDHLKDTKTREELENTKSTISLKNWGHDPIKTLGGRDDEDTAPNIRNNAKTSEQLKDKKTDGNTEADDEQTQGAKRKLAERDGDGDEDEKERTAEEESDDGDVESDAEQRSRKKSKTAESFTETEDDTPEDV